ncbi:predicted protein [Aspergillus terreus NIH2624]|uniref:Uncharacterized protein n=1 Tax=Aspergillus terreus (strain NIH 2624 / FGSC A1156) TaxID=341663 RepID=Q0CAZ4_ASPTN|nr:uncharacterized protein ATEG_09140 [Aspergillus terreus NIH2624]EAU30277.1 predicted protein [Aspergillus terreus NIH2624]
MARITILGRLYGGIPPIHEHRHHHHHQHQHQDNRLSRPRRNARGTPRNDHSTLEFFQREAPRDSRARERVTPFLRGLMLPASRTQLDGERNWLREVRGLKNFALRQERPSRKPGHSGLGWQCGRRKWGSSASTVLIPHGIKR